MRAHYLQHVHFEGPGSIITWLGRHRYEVTSSQCDNNPPYPDVEDIDLLIVLGGPMSALDEKGYPWLKREKAYIQQFLATGKPALGICLGAQLIAEQLDAKIAINESREIGWWPIEAINRDPTHGFVFPAQFEAFHWHGETFSIPKGAIQLARSRACENQAFQWGHNVIGLQFHLETLPQIAADLIRNYQRELVPADYVQSENEILCANACHYFDINLIMDKVLNYLTHSEAATLIDPKLVTCSSGARSTVL